MKTIQTLTLCLFFSAGVMAQPRYDYARLSTERLDRGLVAVRQGSDSVFLSWRILRTDRKGEPFDIYRDGVKLNTEPLTEGGSCFIDPQAPAAGAVYEVRGGTVDGSFRLAADAPQSYLAIPLCKPDGGQVPRMAGSQSGQARRPGRRGGWRDDGTFNYTANDATMADVDGDGQLEIILK